VADVQRGEFQSFGEGGGGDQVVPEADPGMGPADTAWVVTPVIPATRPARFARPVVSVVAGMWTAGEVNAAVRLLSEPVPEAAWAELAAESVALPVKGPAATVTVAAGQFRQGVHCCLRDCPFLVAGAAAGPDLELGAVGGAAVGVVEAFA
jgi:hypothetical protein